MNKELSYSERAKAAIGSILFAVVGDDAAARQCARGAFTGQWEGYESSRMRSRPGRRLASQDTDLNYGVREGMISEARSLEQTYPIAARIKKQYAQYCIGRCRIRWDTSDAIIDEQYRAGWDSWMQICDYKAENSFPKLVKNCVAQGFSEGDMFVQYITTGSESLMVDFIEADRVSSDGLFNADKYDSNGATMVGGIGLDPSTGRKKYIRVWQRTVFGTFTNPIEIAFPDFRHYYDSARVDSVRGVTGYHSVLNWLRDMKEISDAQRAKTKKNSKLALLAKVMSGQASPISLMGEDTNTGGEAIRTESIGDAATAYMFPSETFTVHESNDPGDAWMKHMEFIVRMIAQGVDLPFGVVWSMAGLPKPGVLVELNQAARTIANVQDQAETRIIRPTAGIWLAKEIKRGALPFHPNWFKFKVGRPAYISIDAGRDSVAAINEVKMGMRTLSDWYNETEDDWIDQLNQRIKERTFLEKRCAEEKIDPNTVQMLNQNPGPSEPDTPATKQDIEEAA